MLYTFFDIVSELYFAGRRRQVKETDLKGNAVRCCSSPRYCKKDDSFNEADITMITNDRTYSSDQLQTTVLYQAVWEGKEEDDFEPGDLLDRDKDNAF